MASTSLSSLPSPPRHHLRRRLPSNLASLSWRRTLAPTQLGLPSASPPPDSGRCCVPLPVRCTSQAAVATSLTPGTPVRPTSILVVGATGTLGRQVVRRALDEGYDVRCLVRPRPAPADFLRDWGAIVVNGDLSKPETIPATLVGIHTIIDCATGRPEEPIRTYLKLIRSLSKDWKNTISKHYHSILVWFWSLWGGVEEKSRRGGGGRRGGQRGACESRYRGTKGGGGRRRSSRSIPDACDKGSVVEEEDMQCTEV